jgi:type IV pilus assembly protein PilM
MAKKQNTIGLDIGSSAIKLVQVSHTKQGVTLENIAYSQLEQDVIYDGAIRDMGRVVESVKALIATHTIKVKNVALSVGGHSVIVKKISIPAVSDKDLSESIHWEAEQYIPFDPTDVYLDYQVLQTRPEQGQMDVLLVAAKRDVVDQYVQVVRDAGLKPVVVDTDCFAVQNAFELSYGLPQDQLIALVHVGAENMNLNVISYGITAFTRDLHMGANLYTAEIVKQMGVSYEDAEAYKLGGANQILPQEVERVLNAMSENFAAEINRSLEFHLATSGEERFHKVYLSGGGARLPHLAAEIARKSRTEVELLDPFRAVRIDPKVFKMEYINHVAPFATVALGLSMRARGDRT